MATSYSELKTEIADFIERNDLTSVVDTFIDLCEAEMQRELKLIDFESDAIITVTAGVGTLPTGFKSARSLYWNSNPGRTLQYVTPDRLNTLNASNPSLVSFFTYVGGQIKFAADESGELVITHNAKFVPLSSTNTSNVILADHPGCYLFGGLKYAAVWTKDVEGSLGYDTLFKAELASIKKDNKERKHAGVAMQVRVA